MEEYEADEVRENFEQNETYKHLYADQQQNFNEINDSFRFKASLLELSDQVKELISKEILLANLTNKDKSRALSWLELSADCADFNLLESSKSFYRDVLILSGVSRGHKGFQQDKLNEQRDIRVSKLESEQRNRRKWGRF